ncbi:MAG: hypothetical protein NZ523_15105, partial [Elioraea sp.]|nr:hypothetical protein [Elioraea sp.]
MTRTRSLLLAATAAAALSAGPAQASLLQITGGQAFTTAANNDFAAGWAGRNNNVALTISATTTVNLTFEYLFRESGFTGNRFEWTAAPSFFFVSTDRANLAASPPAPIPFFTRTNVPAGALPFRFVSQANPGNPNANGEAAEFIGL